MASKSNVATSTTGGVADTSLASTTTTTNSGSSSQARKLPLKSYEIYSCTIRDPPYAYAQLRLSSASDAWDSGGSSTEEEEGLDALQAHSYCTAALQQFLGLTGAAVSVEILKVQGSEFWVRVPRQDLGRFSAAITASAGVVSPSSGTPAVLRLVSCGDWLGSLIGKADQQMLWTS